MLLSVLEDTPRPPLLEMSSHVLLFVWILEKVVYGARNFEDTFSFGHETWMLFLLISFTINPSETVTSGMPSRPFLDKLGCHTKLVSLGGDSSARPPLHPSWEPGPSRSESSKVLPSWPASTSPPLPLSSVSDPFLKYKNYEVKTRTRRASSCLAWWFFSSWSFSLTETSLYSWLWDQETPPMKQRT